MVNGPVRARIGLNAGFGVFGPGSFPSPDEIHVMVAGGTAGRFSVAIPGWLGTKNGSPPVTRAVQEPK